MRALGAVKLRLGEGGVENSLSGLARKSGRISFVESAMREGSSGADMAESPLDRRSMLDEHAHAKADPAERQLVDTRHRPTSRLHKSRRCIRSLR